MSIPDFTRAEYEEGYGPRPAVIEGEVVASEAGPVLTCRAPGGSFALALAYGTVAAVAGAVGYALVGLSGFMVSIVAIGVAWLIAKAMMTATGGVGSRSLQIAAMVLTYLAVSCGELIHPLWRAHQAGMPGAALLNPLIIRYALFGPFLELAGGLNGLLGAFILAIGLRTAWQMAAGTPGFGQPGGRRIGPFGIR